MKKITSLSKTYHLGKASRWMEENYVTQQQMVLDEQGRAMGHVSWGCGEPYGILWMQDLSGFLTIPNRDLETIIYNIEGRRS